MDTRRHRSCELRWSAPPRAHFRQLASGIEEFRTRGRQEPVENDSHPLAAPTAGTPSMVGLGLRQHLSNDLGLARRRRRHADADHATDRVHACKLGIDEQRMTSDEDRAIRRRRSHDRTFVTFHQRSCGSRCTIADNLRLAASNPLFFSEKRAPALRMNTRR